MSRPLALVAALLAAGVAVLGLLGLGSAAQPEIELLSVSSAGVHSDGVSTAASVSAGGRFVAFASDATNLTPNDMNGTDIFVRDRQLGTTELVSVATNGMQANAPALFPAISGDGRYVAFASLATNLSSVDLDTTIDVFVHDRQTGATQLVSVTDDASPADDDSTTPSISGDGRYVAFTSRAGNLVPNDDNNDLDVLLYDRQTGFTELISQATDGTHGNFASGGPGAGPGRITSDGRYVVFGSIANNLVANDTAPDDIFVRDRQASTTERVSIATDGTEGDDHSLYGSISDDGRYVVWWSDATTLVPNDGNPASDVFLRDRQMDTTTLLSVVPGAGEDPDGASRYPAISADGTRVAFQSEASNLIAPDSNGANDIFLLRLADGHLDRLAYGSGSSTLPAIDAGGSAVAFQSLAPDLTPGDGSALSDVFVWGKPLATPTPTRTPTPTATRTPTPLPYPTGDANCSKAVDPVDATLILQLSAGLIHSLLCEEQADADEDGSVNAIDATLVLQYVVGLLDHLPP